VGNWEKALAADPANESAKANIERAQLMMR
jgi:hypothetical protein